MTSQRVSPAVRRMVVALAIGALALIASAMPAAAAPVAAGTASIQASLASDCPADSLCLFQHRDFGGQMLVLQNGASIPSLHVFPCLNCDSKHSAGDGNWGDNMSSWINNSSTVFCGYLHINFSAWAYRVNPGESQALFRGFQNDELSSLRPLSAFGSC